MYTNMTDSCYHLQEYGEVASITLPFDKMTGKMRGFAFIEFNDYDSVDKIVSKYDFSGL